MKFRLSRKDLPVPRLDLRVAGLSILVAAVLIIVVGRLYYLQIVQHQNLAELADRNRIRIRRLPALRGLVFDRHRRPLVDTVPSFDATFIMKEAAVAPPPPGRLLTMTVG